jgi:hypothetical protein
MWDLRQDPELYKVSVSQFFVFAVLWLELRAYTLSQSNQPYFCDEFFPR